MWSIDGIVRFAWSSYIESLNLDISMFSWHLNKQYADLHWDIEIVERWSPPTFSSFGLDIRLRCVTGESNTSLFCSVLFYSKTEDELISYVIYLVRWSWNQCYPRIPFCVRILLHLHTWFRSKQLFSLCLYMHIANVYRHVYVRISCLFYTHLVTS